jgi:hypothetical protein
MLQQRPGLLIFYSIAGQKVGFVGQEPVLFNTTVRENAKSSALFVVTLVTLMWFGLPLHQSGNTYLAKDSGV